MSSLLAITFRLAGSLFDVLSGNVVVFYTMIPFKICILHFLLVLKVYREPCISWIIYFPNKCIGDGAPMTTRGHGIGTGTIIEM